MAFSREMNGVDHQADNTTSICRLVFSCSVQFRTSNARYIRVKALFGYIRHFLGLISVTPSVSLLSTPINFQCQHGVSSRFVLVPCVRYGYNSLQSWWFCEKSILLLCYCVARDTHFSYLVDLFCVFLVILFRKTKLIR